MPYTEEEILEALAEVASEIDGRITRAAYNDARSDDHPHAETINRYVGWQEANERLKLGPSWDALSEAEARTAMLEVADRVDGPLTKPSYQEAKDNDHPHAGSICNKFGWDTMKDRLDLDHYSSTIPEADLLGALHRVVDEIEGPVTTEAYDEAREEDDPTSRTICDQIGWNEAKSRLGLEYIEAGQSTPAKKAIDEDYFAELDPESAYWLGFIYADGYVNTDTPAFRVKITIGDRGHLEKLKRHLGADQSIIVDENVPDRFENAKPRVSLGTYNQDFIAHLESWGLDQHKCKSETLPDLPDHLWPHFVRGLFDGDGTSSGKYKSLAITGYADRLERVAEHIPCRLNLYRNDDHSEGYGSINATGDRTIVWAKWMYPDGAETSPKLERKFPEWFPATEQRQDHPSDPGVRP